jgi:hypothetical protein
VTRAPVTDVWSAVSFQTSPNEGASCTFALSHRAASPMRVRSSASQGQIGMLCPVADGLCSRLRAWLGRIEHEGHASKWRDRR